MLYGVGYCSLFTLCEKNEIFIIEKAVTVSDWQENKRMAFEMNALMDLSSS